jgi:LPPG:FO 2-phospho-L-lactate transferase
VRHNGRTLPFQEYMIVEGAAAPVEGVELDGIERARPTDAVLAALAEAELIVIGPSNPVISIGPILALPGMRESLAGAPAPVVAVSPFVDGRSVKGPSEHFCAWAGIETSAAGIARAYADVIDAVVADEPVPALPHLVVDTLMEGTDRMRQLARNILEFGRTLDG